MAARILLLIVMCLGQAVAQAGPELTRQQAVRRALAQLSTYSQAAGNVTLSGLDVTIAEAALRPKWELAPGLILTSPALRPGPTQSFVSANGILETTALLRLRGELDISGILDLEVQRTQALYAAAAAGSLVARQNLVLATEQAYFALALASARVEGSQRNLVTAQEFEKVSRLLFQAGEVPGVDLERSGLLVRDRLADLENQRGLQKGAQASLRALLGMAASEPVEPSRLAQEEDPSEVDLQAFRAELIERRPELAQLEAQLQATRREAELAQTTMAPRLTYSLGLGADANSLRWQGFSEGLGAQAQVALLIPFNDGGVAEAKEKQALVRATQLETGRVLARRQFLQQYESAVALVEAARARIRLTHENLRQAEKIQTVALARYRAGEARIIEVTDAQNALALQRLNWLQAQADFQLAMAQLRYAVAVAPEGNE